MCAKKYGIEDRALRRNNHMPSCLTQLASVCLACMALVAGSSHADDIAPIGKLDADSFPALVLEVRFCRTPQLASASCDRNNSNYAFTETAPLKAADWQISFGPRVYATYANTGEYSHNGVIDIHGLQCANSVEGTIDCDYVVQLVHRRAAKCEIYETGSPSALFEIGCPYALQLE